MWVSTWAHQLVNLDHAASVVIDDYSSSAENTVRVVAYGRTGLQLGVLFVGGKDKAQFVLAKIESALRADLRVLTVGEIVDKK